MEYIEIVLEDVQPQFVKEIISRHLKFHVSDIISSHFWIPGREKICEYTDISDWDTFSFGKGNGDIFIAKLDIGMQFENVVMLISPNMSSVDVTINFEEKQLYAMSTNEAEANFKNLFFKLMELRKTFNIDNIIIGYEPAEDRDMRIIEIIGGQHIFYENNLCSPAIQNLCQLWKSFCS